MINAGDKFEFGFPDFAETIFAEYGPASEFHSTWSPRLNILGIAFVSQQEIM